MKNRAIAYLSGHPLFSGLPNLQPEILQNIGVRKYAKNAVIYRPGGEANLAYVIIDGSVQFEIATSIGQSVHVDIIGKDFLFGELELFTAIAYQSTASAHEEATLVTIPKQTLFALISGNGEFAIRFVRQLSTNFFFYQIICAEREASNLQTKLANTILSMALRFGEKNGNCIRLQLSQNRLSEMLNASRQRISLLLKKWQESGLLECRYGTITITDIEQFSGLSGLKESVITEENAAPYR